MVPQFRERQRMIEDHAVSHLASRMNGLNEAEWDALRSLPMVHRFVGRNRSILRHNERVSCLRILSKGWAIRAVELDEDRRQILDFVLPGDVIGLHVDASNMSACQVIALTACEVGEMDWRDLDCLARQYPSINTGLRQHLTSELVQANDQIARLGRMTAFERVSNFLLDIYNRQRSRNPEQRQVDFPITQTVVADALGLSVVHVNRQVMRLRREGLVALNRRKLHVLQPDRLTEICGFQGRRGARFAEAVLPAAE